MSSKKNLTRRKRRKRGIGGRKKVASHRVASTPPKKTAPPGLFQRFGSWLFQRLRGWLHGLELGPPKPALSPVLSRAVDSVNSTPEPVLLFIERLLGTMKPVGGGGGIQVQELRQLVREHRDSAVAAIQVLKRAEGQLPAAGQLAVALAAAYGAETDDMTPWRQLEREFAAEGREMPDIELRDPPTPKEAPPEPPETFLVRVTERELAECDPYVLVRKLSVDRRPPGEKHSLKEHRGKYLLTFPSLDTDPRPVWEIPPARAYVRKLFDQLPYLPYYLNPIPEFGSRHLLFSCLADPEAMSPGTEEDLASEAYRRAIEETQKVHRLRERAGIASGRRETVHQLNLLHPSVIKPFVKSLLSIRWLCLAIQEDALSVLRDVTAGSPAEFATKVIDPIMELPESRFQRPLKDVLRS